MSRGLKRKLIFIEVTIIVILLFFSVYTLVKKSPFKEGISQMANPASVYCIENNGTLEMRTNENGQYGVCLKNGSECEEWKFFRGECELAQDNLTCSNDSDCVPATCCHASSCVSKQDAPNCKGIMCTAVCLPDSLDCKQGSCVCLNNKCTLELK